MRRLVLASLTGNRDLYAKNIATLHRDGEWRITPADDRPCTLFYGDDALALSVDGSDAPLSRRRARALAAEIGLPVRPADRVVDDLLVRLAGLEGGALSFSEALGGWSTTAGS